MAIKTQLSGLGPTANLDMVKRRVNDNLNLVMQAIYDLDRRVDALADQVAKLGSAEVIGNDDSETH